MNTITSNANPMAQAGQEQWLTRYYYTRAIVSIVWVAIAFAIGTKNPMVAGLLLLAYPAWDAAANWLDGQRSGGLMKNRSQLINVWVSGAATLAVAAALASGMNAVIAVIGGWAIASGLLQLSTAVRRWKSHGAQWAMVLSGAQSALAGALFISQSRMESPPSIDRVAGYAAVGAFYFLLSALWLTVSRIRRDRRASQRS